MKSVLIACVRLFFRFYWIGMIKDIDAFVTTCVTCQWVNKKTDSMPAELHPITVDSPWHRVGIDVVGPLPITSAGMS
jgi:hypothetical protein